MWYQDNSKRFAWTPLNFGYDQHLDVTKKLMGWFSLASVKVVTNVEVWTTLHFFS